MAFAENINTFQELVRDDVQGQGFETSVRNPV